VDKIGEEGGVGFCFVTEGGGCLVAIASSGVMAIAGAEGIVASMLKDRDSSLYQYYKNNDASEATASNKSTQQGSDSSNGQSAANLEPKSNIKITSKTFGQPIETTIAGKR
jgi:hypothetical protein